MIGVSNVGMDEDFFSDILLIVIPSCGQGSVWDEVKCLSVAVS